MFRRAIFSAILLLLPAMGLGQVASPYQSELGNLFDAGSAAKYDQVHALLEKYFSEGTSYADRNQISVQIAASGLDAAVIGRLAHVRSSWTALAGGVYYINEKSGPHDVRYFLGVPKGYTPSKSWPLMVKLPSVNAFLTVPPPDAQRVTQIYSDWIDDELRAHPDALVLMPLINLQRLYGPGPEGMNLVMQPVLSAADKANIDPAQVYLIGHSLAAHAVWNVALHYPTYFAAINPLAGEVSQPWQQLRYANLINLGIVVWADANDRVISVSESRGVVKSLRNLKYPVDYDETLNVGHVPTQAILDSEYAKLRAFKRPLYPKQVVVESNSQETLFNRVDWLQVYEPLVIGKEQRIVFSLGEQSMTLDSKTFRAAAEFTAPNTITLSTTNVRSLRIYLNDQMADLSKPVTVIADGKQVFSGIVQLNVDDMLKDQMFLGRGWRYYTADIDLELAPETAAPAAPTPNASAATEPSPAKHGTIEYKTEDGEQRTFTPGQ